MVFSKLFDNINDNPELSYTDKLVMSVLINLDNDRHCFATNKYLAKRCGLTTNTVSASIQRLSSLGLIDVSYSGNNHRTIICQQFDGYFRVLADTLLADINIKPIDKILFSVIENLDMSEHCFATNDYLADKCHCSEKTITRSLARLEDAGYIFVAFENAQRNIVCEVGLATHQDRIVRGVDSFGRAYNNIYNINNHVEKIKSKKISSKVNYSVKVKHENNHDIYKIIKGNHVYMYNIYIHDNTDDADFTKPQQESSIKHVQEEPLVTAMQNIIKEHELDKKPLVGYQYTSEDLSKLLFMADYFAKKYREHTGKTHPLHNSDIMFRCVWNMTKKSFQLVNLSEEDLKIVIDLFFKTKLKAKNYYFSLFSQEKIYVYRVKEMERLTGNYYNCGVEMKEKPKEKSWLDEELEKKYKDIIPNDDENEDETETDLWWKEDEPVKIA